MLWRARIEGLEPTTRYGETPPWEVPAGHGARLVADCEAWLKAHFERLGKRLDGEAGASILPADYRSYLEEIPATAHFGLDIEFAVEPFPGADDGRDVLRHLYGWSSDGENEVVAENLDLNADYRGSHATDVFNDYLVIGTTWGNFPILLKITAPGRGRIALWDRYSPLRDGSDRGNVHAAANSFTEFHRIAAQNGVTVRPLVD